MTRKDLFEDWDWFDACMWASIGAVVFFFVFLIWDACFRWPEYRDAHHCKQTGRTERETHVQCHLIGKVTTCTPYTSTSYEWVCDEGERIWR